jgi:hypothetical protein
MEEMNLEEMQSQISILKEKIEKKSVVNDKLIHDVISTHTDNIKRMMFAAVVCGLITIAMSPTAFHYNLGMSWLFVIVTDIFLIYCMSMEVYYKRMLSDKTLMNSSILEVAQCVSRFKVGYKRYTLINCVVLLPLWLTWLFVETYSHFSDNMEMFWWLTAGLCVGIVIGGFIGLRLFFRILDNANQIIKEIQE